MTIARQAWFSVILRNDLGVPAQRARRFAVDREIDE